MTLSTQASGILQETLEERNVEFPLTSGLHICYVNFHLIVCAYAHCKLLAAAAAKSLQSCPTLCNPIDGSPPGSAIPGIL